MGQIESKDVFETLTPAVGQKLRVLEVGATEPGVFEGVVSRAGVGIEYTFAAASALALARLKRAVGDVSAAQFVQCVPGAPDTWPQGPFDVIVLPSGIAPSQAVGLAPGGAIWRREAGELLIEETGALDRDTAFPLTDIQHAYWLGRGATYSVGGVSCHVYFEWEIPGLEPDRLEAAWNALIQRHGMLRASLTSEGMQCIQSDTPHYSIPHEDLSQREAREAESRRLEIRQIMSSQVLDAETWPLFDIRLTRLPGDAWCLHLDLDLLIVDVQSFHILLAELEHLYRHPDGEAAPMSIDFRTYLEKLAQEKETPAYRADRAWWQGRLDDIPPTPALPLARDPETIDEPTFSRLHRRLKQTHWERLERRAQDHGLTKSALLMSAFGQVLARWSERAQFTLNLTQFDRRPFHPDVTRLVGDFTSVLLVDMDYGAEQGFLAQCEQNHGALFRALAHSRFSGIEVMRDMGHRSGTTQMPIVFTSLLGMDIDRLVDRGGGDVLLGEPCHLYTCTPQLWLDHQTMVRNGTLEYNWIITDQVFPEGVAQAMFDAYGAVLDHLATAEADWHAPLPDGLFFADQKARRAEVNGLTRPPVPARLESGFWRWVDEAPDAPGVITPEGIWTYGELARAVAAHMETLRAAHVTPGAAIGVQLAKGREQIAVVLAVLSVGCAYVPLARDLPGARLAAIAGSCAMSWAFSEGEALPAGLRRLALATPVEPGADAAREPLPADPSDLGYIIYTSGSTGEPKGVRVAHRAAMNTIDDVNARLGLGPADRIFGLSALAFDLSVYDVFGAFAAGAALVLPDPKDLRVPEAWMRQIAREGVTVWNSVPALLQLLVEYGEATHAAPLDTLKSALVSGDWIPTDLADRLARCAPRAQAIALGGATEVAIWSNWYAPARAPHGWASVPYGYPLANQQYHVLDGQLRDCPDWVEGDLHIGGAGLADGYQNLPEQTAQSFVAHPKTGGALYATGDRARYRPGAILEFLGRRDRQIKLNGFRIETEEVARRLRSHGDVDGAIVGLTGVGATPQLTAWVVPSDRAESLVARHQISPADADARWARIVAAGDAAMAEPVDPSALAQFQAFDALGEEVAVFAILRCLDAQGLIGADQGVPWVPARGVTDDYMGLYQNWLSLLCSRGWGHRDGDVLRLTRPVDAAQYLDRSIDDGLHRMRSNTGWNDTGEVFCDWVEGCIRALPEIVGTNSHGALAILFPDGDVARAEALYQGNLLSGHLGRAAAAVAETAVSGTQSRVLELGAGVGALTAHTLPALDGRVSTYVHSDLSPHFKATAERKFTAYGSLTTGFYDINRGPLEQEGRDHHCDIVLAGNVLHNAHHLPSALAHIRQLLKPGGLLLFVEASRNKALQLVTGGLIEGLHVALEDDRRETGLPMLSRQQWCALLDAAGFEASHAWPGAQTALGDCGHALIAARAPRTHLACRGDQMRAYLAEALPAYMLPRTFIKIEGLPLSANGKVDREALPQPPSSPPTGRGEMGTPPEPGIETTLAELWAEVLDIAVISREDDFFALGGDSLLATRLGALLRARLKGDVELRVVFEAPVLADQAALLALSGPSDAPGRVVLAEGTGPEVVVFHASDGQSAAYRPLARAADGIRYLGLDAPGLQPGRAPATTMAELIARHRVLLPAPGPEGYHLLGWSMGAHTAWEMARSLLAEGQPVCSVVLLDPSPQGLFVPAVHSEGQLLLTCALPQHRDEMRGAGQTAALIDAMEPTDRHGLWREVLARLDLPTAMARDPEDLSKFLGVMRANLSAMVEDPRAPICGMTASTKTLVVTAANRLAEWGAPLAEWSDVFPPWTARHDIAATHWSLIADARCQGLIAEHVKTAAAAARKTPQS